ncbi:MAG TPA: CmpA/NrtA family ABC transporter substrate-binding protein [Myxococcota bacterium]|jgi:nitrate/nitrite transport system substrate-binding protein
MDPEKRRLRIGITPLTDAAPIVVALELGFFARQGLHVELSREPSWANIRDKLAAGALDAAHALAPMPIAATLGLGPLQQPTVTALSLGLGGNAITVSTALRRALDDADPIAAADPALCGRALARVIGARRAAGAPPLRFASVFPVSMHMYELRYWLAAWDVAPERDVRLLVVPPPRMVAELEAGRIDAFCVGEPWNSVAAQHGSGTILLTGHEIWSHAPEKVLAVSYDWARRHRGTHRALLRAILEAARWCDDPENQRDLAHRLSAGGYVDVPEDALTPALVGPLRTARATSQPVMPAFYDFHRFAAGFPWRSHAAWIITQMLRWGQIEKPVDVRAVAAAVYRSDLHREAAEDLGLACPTRDEKSEGAHAAPWTLETTGAPIDMPPDRFLDGRVFDPFDVPGYLTGFSQHELRVPLDELAAAQGHRG